MADMEAPERKKLKSTYQPSPALSAPLPLGWTEHTAPTGHKYFYNTQTKQSTYTRPAPAPALPAPVQPAPPFTVAPQYGGQAPQQNYNAYGAPAYQQFPSHMNPDFNRKPHHYPNQRRPQPEDRPKKKAIIPDCAPWILIYTKLGRRFVHNTDTQESLWKFPQDVMKAVVEFDRLELEKKLSKKQDEGTGANNVPVAEHARNNRRRSASLQREDEAAMAAELAALEDEAHARPATKIPTTEEAQDAADDSSEYEEVEVTDDEDEQQDASAQDPTNQSPPEDLPVEFGEDDMAYQLAQMGEQYGLDPGEYDDGDPTATYEEGAEGLPLTEADQTALFHDLLTDAQISPYKPWETLLENDALISDARWTILPTTRARKDSWDTWCRLAIAAQRAAREATERQDPRIPYLALLATTATPKLYWPEYKRKYKKSPEMKDAPRFGDRERERLYREHVARLKLPSATLKADLGALLRDQPLEVLHRDTGLEDMPKEVLSDVRWISLPQNTRDPLVLAHLSTLGPKPEGEEALSAEVRAEREKARKERERRENALRERERKVDEDKRRRERDIRIGMGRLKEGERELEAAMKIGRDGLKAQLGDSGAGSHGPTVAENAVNVASPSA